MSFQQGLSGLNAASKSLDVISHNIANAGTYGFKAQRAEFADMVAAGVNGAQGGAGIGTRLAAVTRQFTQGNLSSTGNALDLAINGDGFFRVSKNGSLAYTRNGQFQMDKDGFVVNSDGARLTGYPADAAGNIAAGSPVDLRIPGSSSSPTATSQASLTVNLDSRAAVAASPFSSSDASTFNYSSAFTAYDSLGNPQTVSLYFSKTAAGAWDVNAEANGAALGNVGAVSFDAKGAMVSGGAVALNLPGVGGANPTAIALDLSKSTQYGSAAETSALTQNGRGPGTLSGFGVSADGVLYGTYSNGQTKNLGQIALASFTAPNGLASMGGNLLSETAQSGQPLLGAPGSSRLGAIQSGALEDSNVDLTAQLVDMITAQRNYQANAQSIKTQDSIMQTLVNLR